MPTVKILLTFDDGPHAADVDAKNYTLKIASVLDARGIVGSFFVQSRAVDDKQRKNRMSTKKGGSVVSSLNGPAAARRHVIDIHTGSIEDHEKHWKRVAAPPDQKLAPTAQNGLESDLLSAIADIQAVTGRRPKFVRAVGFELADSASKLTTKQRAAQRKLVLDTYARVSLKHIGINLDSFDNTKGKWGGKKLCARPSADQVKQNIKDGMPQALAGGTGTLVVLFHDINGRTAANIDAYISAIDSAVQAAGSTPAFTSTRAEVEALLDATTLTDTAGYDIPASVRNGCGK